MCLLWPQLQTYDKLNMNSIKLINLCIYKIIEIMADYYRTDANSTSNLQTSILFGY